MADTLIIIFMLLVAVILHECAHGWVAYKLGDPTAKLAGRLTLNPVSHIDPVGTLLIPGILITLRLMGMHTFIFGWAKPVPVSFMRLHNPKRDMIWVGLAGPAVNVALALFLSRFIPFVSSPLGSEMLEFAIFINLLLAIFNMIPIPPLDGSRLVMGLLPNKLAASYAQLERYGIFIVVLLISMGLFDIVVLPATEFCGRLLGVQF